MQGPIRTRVPQLTRRALLALAALFPALRGAHSGAPGPVVARDRSVLRLSCPGDAPESLCRALIQALAEQAPGYVIRTVDAGDLRPTRPGDLGVALVMLAPVEGGLQARLDLQFATGPRQTGQAVTDAALPAVSPPLQPAAWRGFAHALAQTVTLAPKAADPDDCGQKHGKN